MVCRNHIEGCFIFGLVPALTNGFCFAFRSLESDGKLWLYPRRELPMPLYMSHHRLLWLRGLHPKERFLFVSSFRKPRRLFPGSLPLSLWFLQYSAFLPGRLPGFHEPVQAKAGHWPAEADELRQNPLRGSWVPYNSSLCPWRKPGIPAGHLFRKVKRPARRPDDSADHQRTGTALPFSFHLPEGDWKQALRYSLFSSIGH